MTTIYHNAKSGNCYFCSSIKNLQEHHISYHPSVVIFLCGKCHNKLHYIIKLYHKIIKKDYEEFKSKKFSIKKSSKVYIPYSKKDHIKHILDNKKLKRVDKIKEISNKLNITIRSARRILKNEENGVNTNET